VRTTDRRGVALIEVLAASVILGIAGLAFVELVADGTRAVTRARFREVELADQDRLLVAYSLLTRQDLIQRLGHREVGPYVVAIERPEPSLFRISIGRQSTPQLDDLVTVVYREGSQE
jgi:prepilin-type N-terminal cleavage/methylation domain-containing protein